MPVVPRSRHTMSLSTHGFQLHIVPSSFRSHRRLDRVASSLKDAPLPMLDQSNVRTEDRHAMMKLDTFQSFRDLSHAVRGCNTNCRKCTRMSQPSAEKSALMLDKQMCTRRQKPVRKWQIDCEGAVRSCLWSSCEKVLSEGSWAGLSCVVSSPWII